MARAEYEQRARALSLSTVRWARVRQSNMGVLRSTEPPPRLRNHHFPARVDPIPYSGYQVMRTFCSHFPAQRRWRKSVGGNSPLEPAG